MRLNVLKPSGYFQVYRKYLWSLTSDLLPLKTFEPHLLTELNSFSFTALFKMHSYIYPLIQRLSVSVGKVQDESLKAQTGSPEHQRHTQTNTTARRRLLTSSSECVASKTNSHPKQTLVGGLLQLWQCVFSLRTLTSNRHHCCVPWGRTDI